MKKNNKQNPLDNSEAIKQEALTPTIETEQGGANQNFPQEYEEQRSIENRMKPQPLTKSKKSKS